MSDNEFEHLHSEVRPIAARDSEERVGWIRSRDQWIEYPAATKIRIRLRDVFTQPRSSRMENILLFGESGVGKTALIDLFMTDNKPESSQATTKTISRQHPVIKVLMPPEPSYMELYRGIFRAVDIPYFERNHLRLTRIRDDARTFLQNAGTQLLLIDEINSLLAGTPAQQRLFLQHLRYLSNDLGIALVCVGTPEVRNALNSDAQLRRRFSDLELPRWTDGDALTDFVNQLVQSLPLQRPSPVDSEVFRKLVVSESGGITHYIRKALERAAISAIQTGREMIDLDAIQRDGIWDRSYVVGPPPYQR